MRCEALFRKIDDLNERYLKVWEDACNIESPTDYKPGVDAAAAYFMEMAAARGWEIEVCRQEVSGDAVCITLNPGVAQPPVTLSGHLDTVHPIGLFGTPAVRRDSEKIYGPGVLDCKGGVVAAFLAMDALEQCGFKERPVQLILQSDEEKSSMPSGKATIRYMCEKSKGSVAFLNCEGHKKGKVQLTRKGIIRYRLTVTGKAAHSAKCNEGANAIAEAAHKILELEKMKDPEGLTCNCGVISGGTAPNAVAASCSFTADIRFATQQELEQVQQTVKRVAETAVIPGCSCILEEISSRPAMEPSEKNDALLRKMNEIYAENGLPVLTTKRGEGGSDAAYITQCGIPCVDSIGTEGDRIHSVEEFAYLRSLAEAAKRMAAVAFCI